jgi:hypothetical protein
MHAQSNIVFNGSFEDSYVYSGWSFTGNLGVEINRGASAGTNYLTIYGDISQEIPTIPGREYVVRFAIAGAAPILHWGNQSFQTFTNLPGPNLKWHYVYTHVRGETNVTRLAFENTSATYGVPIDDIVVGWLDEPVRIIAPPQSLTGVEGGAASFSVSADGGPPLYYQWFFNGAPIADATSRLLNITNLDLSYMGDYFVTVSNRVGKETSTSATLNVEPVPRLPTIVAQPEGQDVPAGYGWTLRVAAIGTAPLEYQWMFNGASLSGATNAALVFGSVQSSNAGTYTVQVANQHGTVLSLPAALSVTDAQAGGYLRLVNQDILVNEPIFDVDGITGLTGSNYVAQIYAGPSPNVLRPVSLATPFRTIPGIFRPVTGRIPDVPPYQTCYAQARVWEAARGASYEAARAQGGKFGFGAVYATTTGPSSANPPQIPIQSFSLRAGLAFFSTGRLELRQRLPGGDVEWNLIGAPGFRYLIEKRLPPQNWVPLFVVTNLTGTVTFIDPDQHNSDLTYYRSRILE